MDATSKPTMACHEVPEAEPAVQGEEEVQVIGYLDLENSGLQLVEGDNTFCLPPEALGEHVLMAEDGKEGQPSIIVLVQDASEDDVIQALARNAQAMVEEQTEFTMNQLENAIVADGQQLVFLSEDAGGSAPDQEGAAHQESGLVYQEGPDESLPEHSATAADNGQVELQPEPQKSPDVNDDESPNTIVAGGQQLVILSEDAGGSAPEQEGAANQESGLVCREGPNESLPEHSATTADNWQVELQPESQKSPDVNDDESPNAIVAGGQQLVILSEDAGGSAPGQEGATHQESELVYQEGPEESLPEHCATTADNGQVELQPESQKSPDVNDDESPNAIVAGGQRLVILPEGAGGSAPDHKGAAQQESGLVCQEGPDESLPEHCPTAADNGQVELQPEPRKSPDVNSDESPNAACEAKTAGSPAAPEDNPESIRGSESAAEPQATPLAHSHKHNGNSECGLVSESETAPLQENIAESVLSESEVLTHSCIHQERPALPDGEHACDAGDGLTGVSHSSSSDLPSQNPVAPVCAAEAESKTCQHSLEAEHEVPVDRSTYEITRAPSTVKEAGEENVDHSVQSEAHEVTKASNDIASFPDHNIDHEEAKEGNLCADQSASEHFSVDTTPTCHIENKSSEKVAKIKPQRTGATSEKPLKKRLRSEIKDKTAHQAVSLVSELKAPEVPGESEEETLKCGLPVGREEKHNSSDTSACPLHKETEHVVSIHVDKLPDRTATFTKGKVRKLSPSKTKEKATSNGDPSPVPDTETHEVGSLQETGDTAPLHEQTNLKGKETMKHLTAGAKSSEELPGKFCSSEDQAYMGPEKPGSACQGAAAMVERKTLSEIAQSLKTDVPEEVGPVNLATEPSAATAGELAEMSRGTSVLEHDEHAVKSVKPERDAVFTKQAGVSEKLETKAPRQGRKKTKGNYPCTSPTPAPAETVVQQKPALLDGDPLQGTKGEQINSTTRPEQSLQSEQNVEVQSKKAKTADEPPHELTEKESSFQSSKTDVPEEVGPGYSATEPSAATAGELAEMSHDTSVLEHDEPAVKSVKPEGDAVFTKQAGASETKAPRRGRKKTKGNYPCTSPTPTPAETVVQQKPTLLDGDPLQGTKGEQINSTTRPEQGLQSEQNVEVQSKKAKTANEPPHKLMEKESSFQLPSDTTKSHEMPTLQQKAVRNHAAGSSMEDELQKSVNGLTSEVSGNDREAPQDAEISTASKNASQESNQSAVSSQGSSKDDSHEGHLRKGFRDNSDSRGATVDCYTLGAQPSCSWQYDPKPSCSWAVDEYEPQPSCSWQRAGVNVRKGRKGKNAKNSGGKLLAALDLVPCHEGSPPGTSLGGGKKTLSKTRRKRNQSPKEHEEVKEKNSPPAKPWNLRVPTKRRKPFVIPDSDDEDFDDYGSEDYPSDTQKFKFEKAFDDLLDNFKTEQAQKAVTEAAPMKRKRGRPPKRKLTTPQPHDTVTEGADESIAKGFEEKKGKLVQEESTAKTSKAKRTERSAKTFKLKTERYEEEKSSAKASNTSEEKSAPTGSSAKTSKGKRGRKPAPIEDYPPMKTAKVESPPSPVASTSGSQRVWQRHVEPAIVLALKKNGSDDDIRMPRSDLRAGDIRIRCQKPSYVSAKASPRYHCAKCDFESSRMQNIVRHHLRDCQHTKSLAKEKDPKSPDDQKGDLKSPDDQKGDPNSPDDQKGAPT